MSYTQAGRLLSVTTPLGKDYFILSGFTGHESISRLFRFQLQCIATNDKKPSFDALLGQTATVEVTLPDKSKKYISGICNRVAQGARDQTFTLYLLDIVPKFWLLTRKTQSRIFQHISVPDILKKVLSDGKVDFSWEVKGTFQPRDFCVQYRESDYAFASRLMEEEGIWYFFKHSAGSHTMVVANDPGSHSNLTPKSNLIFEAVLGGTRVEDRVLGWEKSQELPSGKVTLWDHCFELPHKHLEAKSEIQASVAAGKSTHKLKVGGNDKLELYDWPGAYAQRFDGINKSGGEQPAEIQKIFQDNTRTSDIRMEEAAAATVLVSGSSNVRHLVSGHKFTLQRHFEGDGEWVLYEVEHVASESADVRSGRGGFSYQNHFTCFPAALPFRPPRLTRRPVVTGTQTAVVVGPPGEEIFTDKYGRIKVQFHWDREGKNDIDSSCWLRVTTPWAGKQWGAIHIPRIGQEVVVDFLEGDPDQPIVVGSVYNAEQMPPYKLPDYKTMSTLKSRSTLGGAPKEFCEFRIEDKKGKEQIFIHSQKRMDVRVRQNLFETVGGARNECIGGEHAVTVGGSHDLHVKHDVFFQGDGKIDAHSLGALSLKVDAASKHYASGNKEINARSVTVEGMTKVVLTCGSSFVEVSPMGVTIQGPVVRINSGGSASPTSGIDYETPLDCEGADTGEPGYLDRPRGGGGGGRTRVHEGGYHARATTYNPATNTFTYGGSGIAVTGSPDFADRTLQTLASLDATPTGNQLIDNLQSNGHTTTIREATPAEAAANGGGVTFFTQPAGSNGTGCDSTVAWAPGFNAQYTDENGDTHTQPDEALLGHELNHGDHFGRGQGLTGTPDPADSTGNQEESRTIGINDHTGEPVSENNILRDMGEDWRRTDHDSNAHTAP